MAAGRSPTFGYKSSGMSSTSHNPSQRPAKVPRPYQSELLDIALQENTIIALGTGCGKTHIACMLIKEMRSSGRLPDGKKVLFLAPTDALVRQQSKVIYESTELSVRNYIGGSGVSEWSCGDWEEELKRLDVMIMVAQTALNAIINGALLVSHIGLLIFDECHHARKKHPYREIMRMLETNVERLKCDFPRILGLSASIVTKNLKDMDRLEKEILELEKILHSRAVTATDTKSMSVHVTNPNESYLEYEYFEVEKFKSVLRRVEEMKSFLDIFLQKDENKYHGRDFSAKNAVEVCRSCITDCVFALGELGVGPTITCIDLCVTGLEQYRINYETAQKYYYKYFARYSTLNELEIHFFCNTISVLKKFKKDLKGFNSSADEYSPKVTLLRNTIKSFMSNINSNSRKYTRPMEDLNRSRSMCGIVFTYRRISAVLLKWILNKTTDSESPLIKCGHVVGHGANCTISIGEMNIKEQEQVLNKFRSFDLNLLTATNVLEEGLDVPQCNLIIRFDLPNTPRSYIQSKGRARNKEALLYHMIPRKEMAEHLDNLDTFRRIERILTETCGSRSDASLARSDDLHDIPAYTIPSTGAKITGTSAVMLLNRDSISNSKPYCSSEKVKTQNTSGFVCRLRLPERAPLHDVFESDIWATDELARREVHMKAAIKLHEIGEIDDYLRVNKRSEKETSSLLPGLSGLTLLDSKNSYYENKIPSALSQPLQLHPTASPQHYVYRFHIVHTDSGVLYWGQADNEVYLQDPNNYVGIITSESLPYTQIPTFEVFYHDLNLKISLELISTRTPLVKIHSQLAKFQDSVFAKVVRCSVEIFQFTPNKSNKRSFMICPLIDLEMGMWDFDISCLDAFTSNPQFTSDCEEFYLNKVVTSSYHQPKRYFHIVKINHGTTLRSRFPDPTYPTYEDYYKYKRGITFREEDFGRHALEAVYVSGHINLITSRHKTAKGKDLPKRDFSRHTNLKLFSPHLIAHPIPSTLWRLCVILPSILWRLESFLLMLEVADSVDTMGGKAGERTFDRIGTSYNGAGHGHLNYKTQPELCVERSSCGEGPDLISLLAAFTAASAGDLINLERQEFLGDSILKLISSIHYFTHTKMSEGDLSDLRLQFVSNETLHALAVKNGFANIMRVAAFDARTSYSPPGYSFRTHVLEESIKHTPPGKDKLTTPKGFTILSESKGNLFKNEISTAGQLPFCFQQFNDKAAADCVEAVLCAYVQSGGILQGLKFISYLGTGIDFNISFTGSSPSRHYSEMGHFFSPLYAFSHYFEEYESLGLHLKYSDREVTDLPRGKWRKIQLLQKDLNYEFNNILLLVEAFTHNTFMAKITPTGKARPSYQRLEFLGDALLDYFTCVYMYLNYTDYLPEQLSQLRTAVVNNKRLSTIALKYCWYECILSNEKVTASINTARDHYLNQGENDDYAMIQYPKSLADIVESVVAAVFVDSKFSLDTIWSVFAPIFRPIIEELAENIPESPVNALFKLFPKEKLRINFERFGRLSYQCTIQAGENVYVELGESQENARYKCAQMAINDLK